jgi:ATP-dependent 26S proteasome regulatory subunit
VLAVQCLAWLIILGTSADREIQRTLMELLNQMDGFDVLGKVTIVVLP